MTRPAPLTGTVTEFKRILHNELLTRPAPLTGTVTVLLLNFMIYSSDATHTPHGDGNRRLLWGTPQNCDATRTPHGDGNCFFSFLFEPICDATRTPHGDGNGNSLSSSSSASDATRTPHGDGNLIFCALNPSIVATQPAPLTGTVTV